MVIKKNPNWKWYNEVSMQWTLIKCRWHLFLVNLRELKNKIIHCRNGHHQIIPQSNKCTETTYKDGKPKTKTLIDIEYFKCPDCDAESNLIELDLEIARLEAIEFELRNGAIDTKNPSDDYKADCIRDRLLPLYKKWADLQ